MKTRHVASVVRGRPAIDGAGVHLTRVLGLPNVQDFDPFLMLDSFDATDPKLYLAGFPMHPHRGIETITYLIHGELAHEDSLGNQGLITDGASQWMTAGSGILHQEMPNATERLLGFQLWLNLPQKEKMTEPKYFDILPEDVKVVEEPGKVIRVVAGRYGETEGVKPHHLQASIFDVSLEPGAEIDLPVKEDETAFVFLILGDAVIDRETYSEKSALLMKDGDTVKVQAPEDQALRFALIAGPPLHESVAWGGPIVMNTREELEHAFWELRNGRFIK